MQLAILLLLVAALVLLVLALIGGNTTLAIVSILVSLAAVVAIVRGRRQRQELADQRRADVARQAKVEADKDETTKVLAVATAEASRRAAAAGAAAEDAQTTAAVTPSATEMPATTAAATPAATESPATTETTAVPPASAVPAASATPDELAVPTAPAVPVVEPRSTGAVPAGAVDSAAAPGSGTSDSGDGLEQDPPAADTIAPIHRFGQSRVWVIDGRPRYHLAECRVLDGHIPEAISLSQAVEDGFTPCSTCDPDNKLAG